MNLNSQYPANDMADSTVSLEDIWQGAEWRAVPYRWVSVIFPDGTSFFLSCEELLEHHAERLASQANISPAAVLTQQLIPAVARNPTMLLDMAARMPAREAFPMATGAFWRTAAVFASRWWPNEAQLTLQAVNPDLPV